MIRTVRGDRELRAGAVLAHEHLRIDLSHNKGVQTVIGPEDEADVIADLRHAAEAHALSAVVDVSVPGSGRDAQALRRISDAAGIDVVCATGFYWDPVPEWLLTAGIPQIRDALVREVEEGIAGSGIRCGVIKVGTDFGTLVPVSEKMFIAAAEAAQRTGAAVITHTAAPDQAAWQIRTLIGAGLPAARILIGHLNTVERPETLLESLGRGVFVGLDQIGSRKGPCERVADLAAFACERGLARQIILSSDMARRSRLSRHGGSSYGTVFSEFLPHLRRREIGEAQIATMLEDNPRRLLQRVRKPD